ncbi:sensor histidine kinase [Flavihumibacter sp. R14]|nr:sensor histidine kinase [Flavihumibacter soli]
METADGIGIPRELQPVLFNKYTPAARKGVDGQESVGLGCGSLRP